MPRILLIDDDDDTRAALRDVLEIDGYEVEEARNGRNALERMVSSAAPSLVVLDLEMPVMSGTELIDAMKRHDRLARVPVLILSGSPIDDVPPHEAVVGFAQKPCDIKALLARIRESVRDA